MRAAYADPPYPGMARKHYGSDPSGITAAEVDHSALIERLRGFDAWALSTSSVALASILPLCPEARIGAWVKPFASFKPGVNPAYAWEPVLFVSGRKRKRTEPTVRDWVSANITLQKGTHGAKPTAFCEWLFDLLGMEPGDEFHDLFHGSGAVTRAWLNRGARTTLDLASGGQ